MPNPLVAVIVNSMEEVRRLEMTEGLAADDDADGDGMPDTLDRELRITKSDL